MPRSSIEQQRMVYIVTYSRADTGKFPTSANGTLCALLRKVYPSEQVITWSIRNWIRDILKFHVNSMWSLHRQEFNAYTLCATATVLGKIRGYMQIFQLETRKTLYKSVALTVLDILVLILF